MWFFENTRGKLRYLQSEGAIEGVDLEDDSWLISVGQGLMAACSVAYMYKSMSLKDWVIYNERHGMPGIHGKTDAGKDSDEWDDLVTAVGNFAADWAIVTNQGATIDKVDMSTAGQLPYPPMVELMDRAISALWRGADLSTMSASQGPGQGASLQGDESKTLEEDDAKWLSETLSRNLDRRVIEYAFGEGVQPLAYIKIKTAQKKDIATEIQIDEFLLQAGAPVGVQNTLERYNRPMPAPEEELLQRSSAVSGQSDLRPLTSNLFPSNSVPVQPSKFVSPERSGPIYPGQPTGGDADLRTRAKMANSAAIPAGIFPNGNREQISEVSLTSEVPTSDLSLVSSAVAETLGVRSEWLTPFFAALEAKIRSDRQQFDAELLDAIEAMAKSLPELLSADKVQDTAAIVERLLKESVASSQESES